MGQKIVIDPVTRVEGHGRVTIHLDDQGKVETTRLHIVEFRGFERMIQGRPYWEVPVIVQRLCGICPVSHHLAGAKAIDAVVGVEPEGLTPTGEKMRRLMHYGQMFQSHALHFFHLASPDLLFGAGAPVEKRNIVAVAKEYPELAVQGITMRKFGQEIIQATAGKKIHGISAVPGGIHKNLSVEERDRFLVGEKDFHIHKMIDWSVAIIDFLKDYHRKNRDLMDGFAAFPSHHLSLVGADGGMDLYHGVLRAVDPEGKRVLDDVDYREYVAHIREETRSWSYMKFPYLQAIGKEKGWYRVGPLARLNAVDFIPTPLAQKEFEEFRAYTKGKPNNMSLHTHWARLIELLHAAEKMKELLNDSDLQGTTLIARGQRRREGVGVVEAPRGTLFHHYEVNEDDSVARCNLIVSTTNNNEAMNRAVNHVARSFLSGVREITDGLLNHLEVAIRAYDPCLSCATHAVGTMPLRVQLFDSGGSLLEERATL